jgi:hypothetical protein
MATITDIRPVSAYQKSVLAEHGISEMPGDYEAAKAIIDQLPPSAPQAALMAELGLGPAATRLEAGEALDAYAEAHPEWAEARKAARLAKARATRAANRAAKAESGESTTAVAGEYDEQIVRYRDASVKRYGKDPRRTPAPLKVLLDLRNLALAQPRDSQERVSAFSAMKAGISLQAAIVRTRILDGTFVPAAAAA